MRVLRWLRARLRALVHRDGVASEIREELDFHLRMRTEEYVRAGDSPVEAARRARRQFGNLAVVQDQGYDVRGGGVMEAIVQDVRYALRLLWKQRGFSAVALLTLALGIGLSTALFSVIDAAILHPLPYPHPEQLVDIEVDTPRPNGHMLLGPSLADRAALLVPGGPLTQMASSRGVFVEPIADTATPERLTCTEVGEGYFDLYGVRLAAGRAIDARDLNAGAAAVVVIGYDYWIRRFGGRQDVIGQTLRFVDGSATIVGVAPATFERNNAIWRPFADVASMTSRRGTGSNTIGRLRPGISQDQAERELTTMVQRQPGAAGGLAIKLDSELQSAITSYSTTVNIFTGAVALILLIACVNVAGLLLARGATRVPEMAIRTSIGANRGRLITQLLIESTVLAAAGGAIGAAIAWLALDTLVANIPISLSPDVPVSLNLQVLAGSALLTFATGVLFGLAPAMRLSKAGAATALARGTPRAGAALSRRGGQLLIAMEVALAVVLLAGAGLMLRSFSRLMSVDLGIDPESFITLESQTVDPSAEAIAAYYPSLLQSIRTMPNVAAVGAIDHLPMMGRSVMSLFESTEAKSVQGNVRMILPGYFEAIGIRLLAGRWPTDADRLAHRSVIVINNDAANELFPGVAPLGRTLTGLGGRSGEVIGIADNVRFNGPLFPTRVKPEIYILFRPDTSDKFSSRALVTVIRPSGSISGLAEQLRRTAESIGPRVLVDRVRAGDEWLGDMVRRPRQRMVLLTLLGALGLVLTLVGIFGMTAYAVARRTREIGVRMAFGARPGDVVLAIVSDAAKPMLIGLVTGLGGALLATRAIKSFLFNTTPTDSGTLVAVGLTLAVCAILAAWIPARRAARVDPVTALRTE